MENCLKYSLSGLCKNGAEPKKTHIDSLLKSSVIMMGDCQSVSLVSEIHSGNCHDGRQGMCLLKSWAEADTQYCF